MSEIKKEEVVKTKKEKKKLSKSAIILIVGLIIIAIPCLIFAGILGISALQTGSPREGSRFDNDLVNEITDEDVSSLQSTLSSISGAENVEVKLSQGQLKVYIDLNDTANEDTVDSVISDAYNKVIAKLPINTYFTKTDSAKMYDLQINVYTTIEQSANRQYKLLHKNSAEEKFSIDDMAHPKDAKLVQELENGKAPVDEETEEITEE